MSSFTTVSLLLVGLIASIACTDWDNFNNFPTSAPLDNRLFDKDASSQMRDQCFRKTGSNQLFDDISASKFTVFICLLSKMDVISFLEDLNHLNASTRHAFYPKWCPQMPKALPCFDVPVQKLSKCLEDDRVPMLYGMYNAAPKALAMICKNDGEILYPDDANYDACMQDPSDSVEGCVKFGQRGDICEEMTESRDCLQRKFNECHDPGMMELFDVFHHAAWDNSPCKSGLLPIIYWSLGVLSLVCFLVWCSLKCKRRNNEANREAHFAGIIISKGNAES